MISNQKTGQPDFLSSVVEAGIRVFTWSDAQSSEQLHQS